MLKDGGHHLRRVAIGHDIGDCRVVALQKADAPDRYTAHALAPAAKRYHGDRAGHVLDNEHLGVRLRGARQPAASKPIVGEEWRRLSASLEQPGPRGSERGKRVVGGDAAHLESHLATLCYTMEQRQQPELKSCPEAKSYRSMRSTTSNQALLDRVQASGDVALTWLGLISEKIAVAWSWKLGNLLVRSIGPVHESWLRITRCSRLVHGDFGRAPAPASTKVEFPAIEPTKGLAFQILNGNCAIRAALILPVHRISWLDDSFLPDSARARFLFHSLEWLAEILDAGEQTGDSRYLDGARGLIARWLKECLYREGDLRINLWDDHVTALRAIALCKAWTAFQANAHPTESLMQDLAYALVRHARKLALKAFYRPRHNHGVTQGYALLAIGLTLPTHSQAKRWVDLGRSRLEQQMAANVSADGLHREHSPFYHFYVLRQFQQAHRLAHAHDLAFAPAFVERLAAMPDAGRLLLKPDGRLPALGDTQADSPVLASAFAPELARSTLFKDGGYAVLRTGRVPDERSSDERFLVARLATFDTSHIHRDVLSFELYGWGQDLIVDSGGPFKYGHPLRSQYFLSTRAHNTVMVDDRDQAVGAAQVLWWQEGRGCDAIAAEHWNYPGVRHRRLLALVPPGYLLVIDRLDAADPHSYSQLFHLHPTLGVSPDGCNLRTTNPTGGPTVRIVPLTDDGVALRIHRAATAPYQGWVCSGEAQMADAAVAVYDRIGARATFAVLVIPERPGCPESVSASVHGVPFESVYRVVAEWSDRTDVISVAPSGEVTLLTS